MTKRLVSLFAVALFVVGACGGTTASPSATTSEQPSASTASASPSTASASPSASASAGVDVTKTTYNPEPAQNKGGTVILAEWQFPDTLNYYYAGAVTDNETIVTFMRGLTNVRQDLSIKPELIKSVPTVDNGGVVVNGTKMDVTWQLKDGMKWSDGQPITCDDLIATWKWNMDPGNVGLYGGTTGWEDIESIDGAGSTTCVMHFKKIYEGYLLLVAALYPKHYIDTVPIKDAPTKLYPMTADITKAVFNGPYMPTEIKNQAQITEVPNPYWKTISGQDPNLSQVIMKYYGDADAMIAGYKAGEYDVAQDLNDADLPKLTDIPQNEVVVHTGVTYEQIQANNKSLQQKFGADYVAIKQAVAKAIDKNAINQRVLGGNVDISIVNFVSPLSWFYKDEGKWTAPDVAGANAALDAAGWTTKDANGFRTKNGKTLEMLFCTSTRQIRIDTLTLVASQLKDVGIKADVKAVPAQPDYFGGWNQAPATTPCNLAHGNYDWAEFAWQASPDPLSSYLVYTSYGNPDNGDHSGANYTRYSDPAMDQAFDAVKTSVDFNKVKDAMGTVQDLYVKSLIEFPLYWRKDVWLVNPKLHNFVGNPTTFEPEWNIEDWWMAQ